MGRCMEKSSLVIATFSDCAPFPCFYLSSYLKRSEGLNFLKVKSSVSLVAKLKVCV